MSRLGEVRAEIANLMMNYLRPLGYKYLKGRSEFVRKSSCGMDALGYDLILASDRKHLTLHIRIKIRIDELEEVYVKHHTYVSPADRSKHETVNVLYGNAPTFEYSITAPFLEKDKEVKVAEFQKLYELEIAPFIERYSNRTELVTNLEADSSVRILSDRFVIGCILMSDDALKGDEEGFQQHANDLMAFYRSPKFIHFQQAAEEMVAAIQKDWF